MALARQCGARALVLLAGGNLRALVALLCLGLAAQATLTGVLAPVRQWLQGWGVVQLEHAALPQWLAAQGLPAGAATLGAAAVPALALLAYALRQARGNGMALLCAAAIGALVAAGWWITAQVGADPFEPAPLTSLSFIGPVAEGLLYLQLAVGREFSLGPAIVAGTLTGACATARLTRTPGLAVVTAGDLRRFPGWDEARRAPERQSRSGYYENDPAATHTTLLGLAHSDAVLRGVDYVLAALARGR